MSPEEFRTHGHAVVDWIADYLSRVEQLPVLSQVPPGWVRSQLPARAPEHGESFEHVLADVDRVLLPGITHWQSPNFFAFFPANSSGPSILGELLTAGLGVQGMLWATSPACTELETHVLDWLVDLLDLPERFRSTATGGGVIQDTASSATLCALLAARERTVAGASSTSELPSKTPGAGSASYAGVDQSAGPLTAYASAEAHSSVEKACGIAGLGRERLRKIVTDERFAMRPDRLEAALRADLAAGCRPSFVCATVGTTSTGSVDPLPAIGEVCRRYGVWLHVDAAMAGTAALCEEFRFVHDGLEAADSYCFNPHKWMFVNFDCDCFYVADRAALLRALSVLPEYLKNAATASGAVIDYRDWQVPLGRRFRALKLWCVLRSFGAEGLRARIRQHVAWTRALAERLATDPRFELAAPVVLNLVCFRHRDGDEATQRLLDAVNRSGRAYLSHTRLNGRLTIRVCIAQTQTEWRHVEGLWNLLRDSCPGAG